MSRCTRLQNQGSPSSIRNWLSANRTSPSLRWGVIGMIAVSLLPNGVNAQQANTQQTNVQNQTRQTAIQNQQAGQTQQTVPIKAPPGFPISEEHQQFVDGVLTYWETSSSQIQRLKCNFTRWSYDSAVCNYVDPKTGQMVAYEIAGGDIQFENPDQAYIAVNNKRNAVPPNASNPELQYNDLDEAALEQQRERYICSGDAIWLFDFSGKQLVKQNLPPELQGEGIKNTPMPFLFGAKAEELKQRYWIRPLQSPVENQWHLEIYPKTRADAEHYSVARIVLEGENFTPKIIQLFAPDYNPQKIQLADGSTMPAVIKYQVYEFTEQKINFTLNNFLTPWKNAFRPRTPLGWKLVEKQVASPQTQQAQTHSQAVPR